MLNTGGSAFARSAAGVAALQYAGVYQGEEIERGLEYVARFRPPVEQHVAHYFYGHYYAAMCIEVLPKDKQPYFQDHLAHTLIPLQEKDGCWWDYPLYNYHRQYGTGMAISSLVRCRKAPTNASQ